VPLSFSLTTQNSILQSQYLRVVFVTRDLMAKEAKARIKINQLLESAGWRFFDNEDGNANILLEANTTLQQHHLDALGNDFQNSRKGYIDFLLLDDRGYPLIVLEAKREGKSPLDGKEQARHYAKSENVRFIILSNGDLHYFWDLESGNPEVITEFPSPSSVKHRKTFKPNRNNLADEVVDSDYITISQNPLYASDPRWDDEKERGDFISDTGLRLLRPYQLKAIHALQKAARDGSDRFLFEMATGTGKTLVSAGIIKLFLKSGNASRVLFLVDRLELEDQANKNFVAYLKNDFTTVIYKEKRNEWRSANIVVTTVQSLSFNDKYRKLFSPTDFDLIISDEAHRSIGGNSRAVFEYFIGYKLGLTATPRDYLKKIDAQELSSSDPRAWEKRQLLDTYNTFGCPTGEPTYRYSLLDGVKEGFLINPIVVDARTDITTQLLSDEGYTIKTTDENGEEAEETFRQRQFERKFFSETTNMMLCKVFMDNALKDPITGEIGKSIIFCVSQKHASKITQILNQFADKLYPDMYSSDFAVQVTSSIPNSQSFTLNFTSNNLNGKSKFLEGYKTSKTRVAVTVGMMTTGYDCQDVLNLGLMRPIFSPTDFVQIKGRGTRKFTFTYKDRDAIHQKDKEKYKILDFFANCEFFEEKFDYDEVLKLPKPVYHVPDNGEPPPPLDGYENTNLDPINMVKEKVIGYEGMKIDRKLFEKFTRPIKEDKDITDAVNLEQWEKAISILRERYENRPELFMTLEKLKHHENLDRRLSWREVLERIFGHIDKFKSKDELLDEEFDKFVSIEKPDNEHIIPIKNFMKAYITDSEIRDIVDTKDFTRFANNPKVTMAEFKALNGYRDIIPNYVKDYIPLNTYS